MASIRSYVDGAGGSSGATLATAKPVLSSGVYYFVGNTVTGASDSNAGTERLKPLLTLQQAYTNASANDTIVCLAGHSETISTAITLAKAGLSIVGEGTGSSKPRLTNGTAASIMLNTTATGILMDNLTFPPSTVAGGTIVQTNSAGVQLNALTFQLGALDTSNALSIQTTTTHLKVTNTTFTSVAATPDNPIQVGSASLTDLTFDNITIDGGSFGWLTYAMRMDQAVTRLRMTNIYLLNSSSILSITGTTGYIEVVQATGDSQVNWTP